MSHKHKVYHCWLLLVSSSSNTPKKIARNRCHGSTRTSRHVGINYYPTVPTRMYKELTGYAQKYCKKLYLIGMYKKLWQASRAVAHNLDALTVAVYRIQLFVVLCCYNNLLVRVKMNKKTILLASTAYSIKLSCCFLCHYARCTNYVNEYKCTMNWNYLQRILYYHAFSDHLLQCHFCKS